MGEIKYISNEKAFITKYAKVYLIFEEKKNPNQMLLHNGFHI